MAKPIRATPVLRGEDARRFLRDMISEQKNPNPKRLKFIAEAEKHKDYYLKQIGVR